MVVSQPRTDTNVLPANRPAPARRRERTGRGQARARRPSISPGLIKRPDWNERAFNVEMQMIEVVRGE